MVYENSETHALRVKACTGPRKDMSTMHQSTYSGSRRAQGQAQTRTKRFLNIRIIKMSIPWLSRFGPFLTGHNTGTPGTST